MLSRLCLRYPSNISLRISGIRSLSSSSNLFAPKKEGIKSAQEQIDDWRQKNHTTQRPMSPHLSVYAWTIPMTFSAFNRIYAFMIVAFIMLIPLLEFVFGTGNFADDISAWSAEQRKTSVGTALVWYVKSLVLLPFFFHTFAGFRHFGWDIFAAGIKNMGTLYMTGYLAIALAFAFAIPLTFYHKK